MLRFKCGVAKCLEKLIPYEGENPHKQGTALCPVHNCREKGVEDGKPEPVAVAATEADEAPKVTTATGAPPTATA